MRKNLGLLAGLLFSLLFISGCVPPEGEEAAGFDWTIIVFLALIFGVFYFIFIRPQRKRQKEHQQMTEELRVGDRVITAGGIYGKIESLNDENIVLKVESEATIRVARSSIAGKRTR